MAASARFIDLETCCICYADLTTEERVASDKWGYVCTADRNKCIICHQILNYEELEVSSRGRLFLCRQHWCDCLPDKKPWNYVYRCVECGEKTFCKACKAYSKDGWICN